MDSTDSMPSRKMKSLEAISICPLVLFEDLDISWQAYLFWFHQRYADAYQSFHGVRLIPASSYV